MPSITFHFIYVDQSNPSTLGISMQMKCGDENVPEVATSGLNNKIDNKIILHVWLVKYRTHFEFGESL